MAKRLAQTHDGVVPRRTLREHGVDRHAVRIEVLAGRWWLAGRHTVVVDGPETLKGPARWWWAVWESGSGARLDGVSALLAHGMEGFVEPTIHVTVPRESTPYRLLGVTLHRRRQPDPMVPGGVPRSRPEWATIRAAQWARSDRQAALLLCLPVQQGLVSPSRLLRAWSDAGRGPRTQLIDTLLRDVCDGARSLGELDFADWAGRTGLPGRGMGRAPTSGRDRRGAPPAWAGAGQGRPARERGGPRGWAVAALTGAWTSPEARCLHGPDRARPWGGSRHANRAE